MQVAEVDKLHQNDTRCNPVPRAALYTCLGHKKRRCGTHDLPQGPTHTDALLSTPFKIG